MSRQRCAIGIDFGGTRIKGALVDAKGEVLKSVICDTEASAGRATVMRNIFGLIEELQPSSKNLPLGLSIPGECDTKGKVWRLPNVANFEGFQLRTALIKRLGRRPIAIDNDAICAAFAEHRLGAATKFDNFLQITLGTGIGGGLVLNGELYRGRDGFGAEIGHIAIHNAGRKCGCGIRGCMEAYAGAAGILKTYRSLGGRAKSVKEVSQHASKGKKSALKCFAQVGNVLGHGLASILNTLNLEALVFSGGIRKAMKYMKPTLQETLRERCMGEPVSKLALRLTRLGEDAGSVGAALLAMQSK